MAKEATYEVDQMRLEDAEDVKKTVIEGRITEIKVWGSMTRQWVGAYQPDDAGMSWVYETNAPLGFIINEEDPLKALSKATEKIADALDTALINVTIRHGDKLQGGY